MNNTYRPNRPFTLTSPYGDRADPNKANSREFHAGVDLAAPAGTPVPAATSGVVVYSGRNSGFGNTVVVRNATGDYSLYAHMQDGDRALVGQRVWPGDTIGQVGSTGEKAKGSHLHYSVLPASAGRAIENPHLPRDGGPIGIQVNAANTVDPAKYDPHPHINDSQRAVRMMSGVDDERAPREDLPFVPKQQFDIPFSKATYFPAGNVSFIPASAAPPNAPTPDPFTDRFGVWGSVPRPNSSSASNDPTNLADRFGDWAVVPGGVLGNIGAPPLRTRNGQRSDIPDDVTPAKGDVPQRRLVNLSTPAPIDTPPDAPDVAASSMRPLGVVSGKPMRDYPVSPPIWGFSDNPPDDDELYQRWLRWVDG